MFFLLLCPIRPCGQNLWCHIISSESWYKSYCVCVSTFDGFTSRCLVFLRVSGCSKCSFCGFVYWFADYTVAVQSTTRHKFTFTELVQILWNCLCVCIGKITQTVTDITYRLDDSIKTSTHRSLFLFWHNNPRRYNRSVFDVCVLQWGQIKTRELSIYL